MAAEIIVRFLATQKMINDKVTKLLKVTEQLRIEIQLNSDLLILF